MTKSTSLYLAIAIIISAILLQGCTLIGRGIGTAIDNRKNEKGYLEIGELKPGNEVEFVLRDGKPSIKGSFLFLDSLNTEDYLSLYEGIRSNPENQLELPLIGDTLIGSDTLILSNFRYEFRPSNIKPHNFEESRLIALNFESIHDKRTIKIYLSEINVLNFTNGKSFGQKYLMELVYKGKIPLKSAAILAVGDEKLPLELNNLYCMRFLKSHKARNIGTWVGAFLDAGVLVFGIILKFALEDVNLND